MFAKLRSGLVKTRESIIGKISNVIKLRSDIDEQLFEELEEILIAGDVGVNISLKLIEEVRQQVNELKIENPEDILNILKAAIKRILESDRGQTTYHDEKKPLAIMVVGVNGTGKTTTIGKLAYQYKTDNKKVLLAAADTFRAAASEQLEVWAQRADVDIIRNLPGADPASIAYDALNAAIARNLDVLIVDTAGRLHTKINLMEELKKIKRVLMKLDSSAPQEIYLVMDATTGQNGLSQARQFTDTIGITGIILTKLDGTAKGGMVLAIKDELGVPVKFIGVGEQLEDLQPFDAAEFVEALFQ